MLFASCNSDSEPVQPTASPAPSLSRPAATPTPTRPPTPDPDAPRDIAYRIQEGDVLGLIAERYGVSVEAIMADNGITDETAISVGQIITITGVDPALAGVAPPGGSAGESPIGFHMTMPIAGACLPPDDDQMPNSLREYRHGIHEGVDFFTGFACVDVPEFLPVLAAAAGTVIRADHEYKDLTARQVDDLLAQTAELGYTPPGTLDRFRGRQVWIDHGNGIVTRYCHLADIPEDVSVGKEVQQGQTIGFVGDSGTPEALDQPGYNKHLHFEIRVGQSYLGAGLPPEEVRALYEAVFGLR